MHTRVQADGQAQQQQSCAWRVRGVCVACAWCCMAYARLGTGTLCALATAVGVAGLIWSVLHHAVIR